MNECYLCGISEDKALLYEGIQKNFGIVKACRKCYFKEKFPLIEKKEIDWDNVYRGGSVRERLSKMSRMKVSEKVEQKKIVSEDVHLKDLVEKNFKREILEGPRYSEDIVDNFHWIIMRKRRSMKISREELAKEILEQPLVIEALEKGNLPRNYKPVVKKIEAYLGIRLFREGLRKIGPEDIVQETKVPSGILLSDLKKDIKEREEVLDVEELSLEKVKEVSGVPVKEFKKERKELDELSDEDVERLVWGRG